MRQYFAEVVLLYFAPVIAIWREFRRQLELREALVVARSWMPDRPLVMSAWVDVAHVNQALGWSLPEKPPEEDNPQSGPSKTKLAASPDAAGGPIFSVHPESR